MTITRDRGRARSVMAENHTLVPEGFRRVLESDFDLVGTAEDERTLVNLAVELCPDAVLLDVSMPLPNAFEVARQMQQLAPSVKLILVTVDSEHECSNSCSRTGPSGYLFKRSVSSEAAEGGQAFRGSRSVAPSLQYKSGATSPPLRTEGEVFPTKLSDRERQVLQLIAEGRQAKESAHLLNISPKTVEFHKQSIARKLGLRTTAELTRYAVRQGLVEA